MISKDKQAYLFLILTTLFWAGNFIVGKAASFFDISPFTLNFYRWIFAWLILAPFTIKEIIEKKNYIIQNIKLIINCSKNIPFKKNTQLLVFVMCSKSDSTMLSTKFSNDIFGSHFNSFFAFE